MKKWSEAVGQELAPNSKLCNAHFDESDIIWVDRTVLTDGSIFESKRLRPKLKLNSTPKLHLPRPPHSMPHSVDNSQLEYVVYAVVDDSTLEDSNDTPETTSRGPEDENDKEACSSSLSLD